MLVSFTKIIAFALPLDSDTFRVQMPTEETSLLNERIDLFFGEEPYSFDELIEKTKTKTISWKQRPSLKEILTWSKQALQSFWQGSCKSKLDLGAIGVILVGLSTLCFHYTNPNNDFQFFELAQLCPKHLLASFPKQIFGWFFVKLCHEAGHILVNYLANGHIPSMHLGAESLEIPSDSIEIFPQVNLCGINPDAHNFVTPVMLLDLEEVTQKDTRTVEKSILRVLAQAYPNSDLQTLYESAEYKTKLESALHKKNLLNHGKIAAYYAAGPLCGLASNAALKAAEGISTTTIDLKDIGELKNFLPIPGYDGYGMVAEGFGYPNIAKTFEQFGEPLDIIANLGYLATVLSKSKISGGLMNLAMACSGILRSIGITMINIGCTGFVHITPQSSS